MKIRFSVEKETKNTVRYNEVPEDGKPPAIGVLYVQKPAAAAVNDGSGYPAVLLVTIEAG